MKINKTVYPYDQLSLDILPFDLVSWLSAQHAYPKVYWQDKQSGIEHAAVGHLLFLNGPPTFDDKPKYDVRFYGGMSFPSTKQGGIWGRFSHSIFWLPRFEVIQSSKATRLIAHFLYEKPSLDGINNLDLDKQHTLLKKTPKILKEEESLSMQQWERDIDYLLSLMQAHGIEKVVLGRKREISFLNPPCAWSMVENLKHTYNTTVFAFHISPHEAFLGASPERFFHRHGQKVYLDATAGTRRRGLNLEEDCLLEKELQESPKERREFFLVKKYMEEIAYPLSESYEWNSVDTVLKTTYVQHLHNRVALRLKEGISDLELIRAFHPTPAVGGYPKEHALALIDQLESFQRGWYAAPVGWISALESHLIVAIRSCLLKEDALHLFGAAGILADSVAKKEWEEIDQKMRTCVGALL